MAAITWTDVTDRVPALSTLSSDTQDAILADVAARVFEATWGAKYTQVACYLAAHLGVLAQRATTAAGAGSGPLTSESVGPLSRSWAAPSSSSASDISLTLTPWGVLYLEMLRGRTFVGLVA